MRASTLHSLSQQRLALRLRWEALLRDEPVNSPLAHPDSLIHLMDWTLDNFFAELRHPSTLRDDAPARDSREAAFASPDASALCPCARNPFIAYFATAECALVETLLPLLSADSQTASLATARTALQRIGRAEIATFCAICQQRRDDGRRAAGHAAAGSTR
jgi:hypothetical protein